MIDIVITSFNEPKATLHAVNTILSQKIPGKYRVTVADPFPQVGEFLKKNIKSKNFNFFLDPGEGKSHTLNILFQELNTNNPEDIIIFTDGDVHISENAIPEILKQFENPKIGCVTGRPVSTNSRNQKYGYWSKLVYDGIDKVRKNLSEKQEFFQCSGYLFAIRNSLISEINPDVPEDCIIPYEVWKKDYKIGYASNAEVYVQYPSSWKDWLKQRVRTIKAHENISKLYPEMPRTKSLFSEIKKGALFSLTYPKSPKEFFWTAQLVLARLHIYQKSFSERNKKAFDPAWRDDGEIQTAKPMDY